MKPKTRPSTIIARVKPETRQTLDRIAELTEQSLSSIINEILEAAMPGLKETVYYLEEAKKLDDKSKEALANVFKKRADTLQQNIEETVKQARDDVRQRKLPM